VLVYTYGVAGLSSSGCGHNLFWCACAAGALCLLLGMAKLKALKRSIGKSGNEWEDVVQEAWVSSMTKVFGKEYFDKYLHKAMVNIALNTLRRNNQDALLSANLQKLLPLVNLESLDLICDVHRVFEKEGYLPNEIHACYLYFCADFSLREIVKIYGKTHTTWRRFFDRTRTLFRKELKDYRFLPTRKKGSAPRSGGAVPPRK